MVDFMRKVSFHRALDLVGTFTHFATADCPGTLDFRHPGEALHRRPIAALREAGIDPGIVHCANSAAASPLPRTCASTWCAWASALYGYAALP